jgi:hypothetical protein
MRSAFIIAAGLLIGIAVGYGKGLQAQPAAPRLNMVIVCVRCIPDDMPQESYNAGNILLDQNTGNLWFYPALSPGVKPRLLGTLPTPGQPIAKP